MIDVSIGRTNNTDSMLTLENDSQRVEICLLKGAETIGLTHKKNNLQVIKRADGYEKAYEQLAGPEREYEDNFTNEYTTGAWFEMFPHAGVPIDANVYDMPQHGDLRTTRFSAEILEKSDEKIVARVFAASKRAPYTMQRVYTVSAGTPLITVDETAVNTSGKSFPVSWGHHPSFSMPFADQAVLNIPAGTIVDKQSNRHSYPIWNDIDIRRSMPAGGDKGFRMLFLTDLRDGWFTIANEGLGSTLRLEFDPSIFPWVWYYDTRGGEGGMSNLMALEFVSGPPYAMDKTRIAFNDKLTTTFRFGFVD